MASEIAANRRGPEIIAAGHGDGTAKRWLVKAYTSGDKFCSDSQFWLSLQTRILSLGQIMDDKTCRMDYLFVPIVLIPDSIQRQTSDQLDELHVQ